MPLVVEKKDFKFWKEGGRERRKEGWVGGGREEGNKYCISKSKLVEFGT